MQPLLNLLLDIVQPIALQLRPVHPLQCLAEGVPRVQVAPKLDQDAGLALVELPLQLLKNKFMNLMKNLTKKKNLLINKLQFPFQFL